MQLNIVSVSQQIHYILCLVQVRKLKREVSETLHGPAAENAVLDAKSDQSLRYDH